MDIEFDPAKDAENVRKHGISLARAAEFNLSASHIEQDVRRDYGEHRFNAIGVLDDIVHSLTFTLRSHTVRAISLRPANRKERRVYAESLHNEAS